MAPDVAKAGVSVVSGGTDVHLVLVDLRDSPLDGQAAEDLLHEVGITVNRNAVPNDPRPPMVTSGLRIGTPALATRGFGDTEFTEVADIIATALATGSSVDVSALKDRATRLARAFPLYDGLEEWSLVGADAGLSLARISARAPITARHGGARFHEICVCELQLPHGTETCR